MRMITRISAILLAGFMLVSATVYAQTFSCTQCGMKSEVNAKFTSKISKEGRTFYFCDIGDLFAYLQRKKMQDAAAEVKDFVGGEWIDARKAAYVQDGKKFSTPMGWGIAAFKDPKQAAGYGTVMDFPAAMKAAR